ncbi:MAG: hypothetical protein WBF90_20210 [Rivularia sp. (in: cyanobacteria)]
MATDEVWQRMKLGIILQLPTTNYQLPSPMPNPQCPIPNYPLPNSNL